VGPFELLAPDPFRPGVLFARLRVGTPRLVRSDDEGRSWHGFTDAHGLSGTTYPPLAVPAPGTVYAAIPNDEADVVARGTVGCKVDGIGRPVAVAGGAREVAVGQDVALDGNASAYAASFAWTLRAAPPGSAAALARAHGATTSFRPDVAGTYVVELVVEGGHRGGLTSEPAFVVVRATAAPAPPSWQRIHADVVAPQCAGCHGESGLGGLSGLQGCASAHSNLVGVASTQLTTMPRVTAGDAAQSWLMHKLDGTHATFAVQCTVAGCGTFMPPGGVLDAGVRDSIRAWITAGAPNDCP
jgi:hypothetical protein